MLKGEKEYGRFKEGKSLTFRQAIIAQCFACNGEREGGEDCLGLNCPLYQYMPYRKSKEKGKKKELSVEERAIIGQRLKKGREASSLSSESLSFKGANGSKKESLGLEG